MPLGYAGYMVFEQMRIPSQMQPQAFQVIAFLFVEAGAYMDRLDVGRCLCDVFISMPLIGACTCQR